MKIVFLGDLVTDCGRDRKDIKSLGNGFVKILSDKLVRLYPDRGIEIINKGAAEYGLADMVKRLEEDVLSLKPDVVVAMAGMSDALRSYEKGERLDLARFRNDLTELIGRLKAAGAAVIFLEPFLLPAPDKLELRGIFDGETEIINDVCLKLCDGYIAYDEILNGVIYAIPYTDYSPDGISPTHLCSCLIADTAIKALQKRFFK